MLYHYVFYALKFPKENAHRYNVANVPSNSQTLKRKADDLHAAGRHCVY